MVTEEHHASMVAFGRVCQQIEQGVVVEEKILWVTGLRANDVRTLNGITTEEDGKVQANDIVVAFTGVELEGKASWVAG